MEKKNIGSIIHQQQFCSFKYFSSLFLMPCFGTTNKNFKWKTTMWRKQLSSKFPFQFGNAFDYIVFNKPGMVLEL